MLFYKINRRSQGPSLALQRNIGGLAQQHASMKRQVAKTTLKDGGSVLQQRLSILRHNLKNPGLNIISTKLLPWNISGEPQTQELCISASRC